MSGPRSGAPAVPVPPARDTEAPRTRRQRLAAPALTGGLLGAAVLALHVRDPHVSGSWGFCPGAALGWWCPGCGGLRAVHDLTDLRVAEAASSNLAVVVAAPLVAAWLGWWGWRSWTGASPRLARRLWAPSLALGVVLVVAFTVLRNTAGGGWLAP